MQASNATRADLLMVLVTLLAAISWMFSKEAILLMPPQLFMGVRFLLAALMLAIFAWPQLRRLSLEQCWRGARIGLVFGIGMSFWATALSVSSHIGEGAFLTCLSVVFVPVLARLLFREEQPASTWLSLPVAIAGLALLSLQHGFRLEAGQILFTLAAAIFALFFTLNTHVTNVQQVRGRDGTVRQRERIPVLALTTLVLFSVGCLVMAISAVLEPWRPTFSELSPTLAGWVLASALIGTAARFLVQTWAQSLSSHNHGVIILVLEPIWVALIAAVWFGETMSLSQLGGCLLIFMALAVNRWTVVRKLLKSWLQDRQRGVSG